MGSFVPKRLFSHGGSKSIDLPAAWIKKFSADYVELEVKDDCIIVRPKDDLTALEDDPMFSQFVKALLADAMKNPEKLKDVQEVWDEDWDDLLEGVDDYDE